MTDLIYLDYNCFQRGFDDLTQTRIKIEAIACQEIFTQAERDKVTLIWSGLLCTKMKPCFVLLLKENMLF